VEEAAAKIDELNAAAKPAHARIVAFGKAAVVLDDTNALRRLDAMAHRIPMQVAPAAAPLAQVNPLAAFGARGFGRLFSTHPPTEERVARLEAMAAGR
jgi:Zn-dependent protease with chaperone function